MGTFRKLTGDLRARNLSRMPAGRPRLHVAAPTTWGRNIQRLREQRGWSQAALAERVAAIGPRTSGAVLSRIESGIIREPSATLMAALARALSVTVERLFAEETGGQWAEFDRSLSEFLASSWAADIHEDELAVLPGAMWTGGRPTVQGWYHALMMVRAGLRASREE